MGIHGQTPPLILLQLVPDEYQAIHSNYEVVLYTGKILPCFILPSDLRLNLKLGKGLCKKNWRVGEFKTGRLSRRFV